MKAEKTNIIHFPDLCFVNYCYDNYGINRGVYNVIDQWFFDQGIYNIIERRITIIRFLENLPRDTSPIRFGSGGLKATLLEFYEYYFARNLVP